MVWFKELGFSENPLDIRPNPQLIGLDEAEKQLKSHIEKGDLCFINGLTGSGKTSLLTKVQKEMKGFKFIYLDAQDLPAGFNLEKELSKKRGFFDFVTLKRFPSKKPVLIIDEFQDTDPNVVLEARSKWENATDRKIKSIVIAQIDGHLKNVTPSFKERIGKRTITLPTLTDEEMRKILQRRLNNGKTNYFKKLHEETLNLLVAVADGNPRRLLEYSDAIFEFHHSRFGKYNPIEKSPNYLVSYYAAKEILDLHGVNIDAYKYLDPQYKSRKGKKFKGTFTAAQSKLLKVIMNKPHTAEEIAKKLKIKTPTALKRIKNLVLDGYVEEAGSKNKKKLWKASEHVKRLTVRV